MILFVFGAMGKGTTSSAFYSKTVPGMQAKKARGAPKANALAIEDNAPKAKAKALPIKDMPKAFQGRPS